MRYETVEERLVLSADPLPALVLHGSLVGAVQQETVAYDHAAVDLQNAPSPTPMLGTVNATTGVNYVHDTYHLTGAGQTVAVIDSGIAYDHYNLGRGYGANYRVVGGWDFAENDANPYDDAPAGFHGTHVAGIIGSDHAVNTGVAPDVDLVALRVFNDSGQGSFAWVESALQWVIANRNSFENPITTVNMSLGVPAYNGTTTPNWTTLEDELRTLNAMGIFVSVSAGNDFAQFNAQGLSYPAVSQYVVPVASANDAGTAMSSFSQRDDRVLVAPGETITSTVPDTLFSFDGRANDWASASGTSMASPYVAGASVLVRQAYWSIGVTNVSQQMIYDKLFSTADLINDPVTAASYHFIDVQAAVASILDTAGGGNNSGSGGGQSQPPPPPPTDTDATGNTAQTAAQLGTLGNGSSFSGQMSNSADNDFYRFTVATTGRVTLTVSPAAGLTSQWQRVGGTAQVQGNAMSFDVVAGQSYVVGLSPGSGVGSYTVGVTLQSTTTDVGTVEMQKIDDVQIAGERWYRATATRDGYFTVEARTAGGQKIDVQIYNGAQQLIAGGNSVAGYGRADAIVTAGQSLLIRVSGNSSDTDLTLANVVSYSGKQFQLNGGAGNDVFTVRAGADFLVSINGLYYSFLTAHHNQVVIVGGAGNDHLQITGTSNAETAELRAGSANVLGSGWSINSSQMETAVITGGGGNDTAKIFTTSTSPSASFALNQQPTYNFNLSATGLDQIAAESGVMNLGTVDVRQVADARVNGERWFRAVTMRAGYFTVEARSAGGQNVDVQIFSEANQLIGDGPNRAGYARADAFIAANQTVLIRVSGNSPDTDLLFANVMAVSGQQVQVFGTSGADTFTYKAGLEPLLSVNGLGYSFSTIYHNHITFQGGGGVDSLKFTGTSANETADVRLGTTRVIGGYFELVANNIENVNLAGGGGNDVATLWDSPGDDVLTMSSSTATLRGAGFEHTVANFRTVSVYATAGGVDVANTTGVAGNGNFSTSGFSQVTGNATSWKRERDALDLLFQSFSQ